MASVIDDQHTPTPRPPKVFKVPDRVQIADRGSPKPAGSIHKSNASVRVGDATMKEPGTVMKAGRAAEPGPAAVGPPRMRPLKAGRTATKEARTCSFVVTLLREDDKNQSSRRKWHIVCSADPGGGSPGGDGSARCARVHHLHDTGSDTPSRTATRQGCPTACIACVSSRPHAPTFVAFGPLRHCTDRIGVVRDGALDDGARSRHEAASHRWRPCRREQPSASDDGQVGSAGIVDDDARTSERPRTAGRSGVDGPSTGPTAR